MRNALEEINQRLSDGETLSLDQISDIVSADDKASDAFLGIFAEAKAGRAFSAAEVAERVGWPVFLVRAIDIMRLTRGPLVGVTIRPATGRLQ